MKTILVLIILLATNLPKTFSQNTVTIPRDVAANLKQWADAAKSFKQERDSALSELSVARSVLAAKDTVIVSQDRVITATKTYATSLVSLNDNLKKQNSVNMELVDYWKGREKKERRSKNVWRIASGALAAGLIYSLAK